MLSEVDISRIARDMVNAEVSVPSDEPDHTGYTGADAQSATPLPPDAPLPAAADLFGTAPVAPTAGEANATPAPPPPVPTAPPMVAPPAPASPAPRAENGEFDKEGLPWDARIHSGSREKIKDGTWRQRRNLADGVKETVEAELRALMAIQVPGVTLGGPIAPVSDIPPPPAPLVAATVSSTNTTADAPASASPVTAPVSSDVPNVPPLPVPAPPMSAQPTAPIPSPLVPPAPTAAAGDAPITFAMVMRKITDGVSSKKITPEQVHAALATVELAPTQMNLLASRPALIPAVNAYIDSLLIGAGGV
jgi:hypothetical protein